VHEDRDLHPVGDVEFGEQARHALTVAPLRNSEAATSALEVDPIAAATYARDP
jgi:hypothetical protein